MTVFVTVRMGMIALAAAREVHIKLHSINGAFLPAIGAERVALELELLQLRLQRLEVRAQINHRAQKHIAANAAENIEVKSLHQFIESAPAGW